MASSITITVTPDVAKHFKRWITTRKMTGTSTNTDIFVYQILNKIQKGETEWTPKLKEGRD